MELISHVLDKPITMTVHIQEIPLFMGVLVLFDPGTATFGLILFDVSDIVVHVSDVAE
jgi:hypothetical protein